MKTTIRSDLRRLWFHLGRRRQRQYWLLMGLIPVSAFAEIVTLGAVLPFLSVLTAPDKALTYPIVGDAARVLGFTSSDQLVLPLTVAFAVAALMSGAIRSLLLWANTRLAVASGSDLSVEAYRRTLYQPYSIQVSRNSSEMISGINDKVNMVVFGVLLPLLTLVGSITVAMSITLAIVVINPVVALVTTAGFGASYGLISWRTRRRLERNSQRVSSEQTQVIKVLQEGLGGIRDVLLDGTQSVYCDIYRRADLPLRRALGDSRFIGQFPRFAIEALAMVMIAALAYFLSSQPGGIGGAVPTLGALALGGQRLLPALQQAFGTWANVSGNRASLAVVVQLLDQPLPQEIVQPASVSLSFNDAIRFNDVCFRYANDDPWVLDRLNLSIPKGARIGLIGGTGSGKSTISDLLMGLLTPTDGELLVDGQTVTGDRLKAWQRTVAHVPQSIFLADATVAENIALGVPHNTIDVRQVQQAARQAQIADFIESRPEGYDAVVGERGVRLSGGQRQRIGIARALYKQASMLVFDEATSGLDNATEQSVIDAIEGLPGDLTILLIAHRLTALRHCDTIMELDGGRVVAPNDDANRALS